MTKITDNATFRTWLLEYAAKRQITLQQAYINVAEALHYAKDTVENWARSNNPMPLNARTAALIRKAVEEGRL